MTTTKSSKGCFVFQQQHVSIFFVEKSVFPTSNLLSKKCGVCIVKIHAHKPLCLYPAPVFAEIIAKNYFFNDKYLDWRVVLLAKLINPIFKASKSEYKSKMRWSKLGYS